MTQVHPEFKIVISNAVPQAVTVWMMPKIRSPKPVSLEEMDGLLFGKRRQEVYKKKKKKKVRHLSFSNFVMSIYLFQTAVRLTNNDLTGEMGILCQQIM